MVDPCTYIKVMSRNLPFYADQIREADVIVANKLDRVSPEELARFRADLPRLNAHARVIETRFGEIPLDALLVAAPVISSPGGEIPIPTPSQGHAHGADQGERLGFRREAAVRFQATALRGLFLDLHAGKFGVVPWRAKGLFHCQDGWRLFQLSGSGVDESTDAPNPGDNRCEIIAERLDQGLRERLTSALEACLLPSTETLDRSA